MTISSFTATAVVFKEEWLSEARTRWSYSAVYPGIRKGCPYGLQHLPYIVHAILIPMFTPYQIRIALVVIMCSIGVFTNAQTVWNKTYLADRPVMLFSSVVADSDSFIWTGVTDGSMIDLTKSVIGSIDANGQLNNLQVLIDSDATEYGVFWNSLLKTENGYVFTGYAYDTAVYIILGIADNQLSGIKIHKYYTANAYAFQGRGLTEKNGNYYICGVLTDDTQNDPNVFLVKIDSTGNRLWQKTYGLSNWLEECFSLTELNNEHLLIGAARLNINTSIEIAHTWLIEVDTDGIVKRQRLDPNDSTYAPYAITQTSDGGFIYASQRRTEDNPSWTNQVVEGMIVKLDSAFQKEWVYYTQERPSNYGGMKDVEICPDGNYIACGTRRDYETDSNIMSGWVVKLNPYGQVIWNKEYRGISQTGTFNFLTDIDVLPDGSLIAVGQCQGNGSGPVQVGWFLKLDSNGCEIENCLLGVEDDRLETLDNRQIQLQPNPANGSVHLIVENEMIGGTISIYSITGAFVMQQKAEAEKTPINIAALNQGIYIVTVQKQGQVARGRLVVE